MEWLLYLPIILSWSIRPFFFKSLTKYITNIDTILVIHFVYHMIILSVCVFTILFNYKETHKFIERIKTIPLNIVIALLLVTFLAILSQYLYFTIVRKIDVNKFIHIIRGGSVLLIILIGYYFYKEEITLLKLLGILLILIGMYLVNNH